MIFYFLLIFVLLIISLFYRALEKLYNEEKQTIEGELQYSKAEREREKMLHEMFESRQAILEEKREALVAAKEVHVRAEAKEFHERRQLQVQETQVSFIYFE